MAASNPQLMYSMPPQYQEPVQYQYYATEQPPPPPPPLSPYPSVYSQPPPPPLPYDHQSLVGGIKRSAEDAWADPDYTKRARPDSWGVVAGPFPQRPGEKMCAYYMTTSTCSFGASCRFDHPTWVPYGGIANWKEVCKLVLLELIRPLKQSLCAQVTSGTPTDPASLPQRPGETVCAYYMKTGECKYGIKCRFDHPKDRPEPTSHNDPTQKVVTPIRSAALNSKGLPIRPGEIDCVYYCKTGSCKYGASCRFNHPEANLAGKVLYPAAVIMYSEVKQNSTFDVCGCAHMQGQESAYAPGTSAVGPYPQRPSEPDCSFFMKTGECSFGPTCRFNHPPNRVPSVISRPSSIVAAAVKLSLAGLPRRESGTPCAYYMKTGACKFGPTCKFDHPTPGEVAAKALEAARVEVPVMLDASLSENSTLVLDDQSVLPPGTDVVVETYRSTQQV
ncbi:unnamed protein product [Sphagnum compactum]